MELLLHIFLRCYIWERIVPRFCFSSFLSVTMWALLSSEFSFSLWRERECHHFLKCSCSLQRSCSWRSSSSSSQFRARMAQIFLQRNKTPIPARPPRRPSSFPMGFIAGVVVVVPWGESSVSKCCRKRLEVVEGCLCVV